MAVHYTKIYDPLENEEHREVRWEEKQGVYVQYEGYGRDGSAKDMFRNSMNVNHPLWSSGDYDKEKTNEVYPWSTSWLPANRVSFNDTCWVSFKGEEGSVTTKIDPEDRENRISRNFANMMCDYAEKCGPSEKKIFFQKGGRGMKWISNEVLMEKFGLRIEEIHELMEDPEFKLSLSDASVKNFPRRIFDSFYERYTAWFDEKDKGTKSNFNAEAKVFVPGEQWMPLIQRSSPKMIGGVYKVYPPPGVPVSRRPQSKVSSEAQLCWQMKSESDEKLKEIEKKLELLIGMNGPVVEAKPI